MRKLIVVGILLSLVGCKQAAEKITTTTVSAYLNESNCDVYEKIMSGSLADHQIIILESAPVFSLFSARKADEHLLRFFVDKYQKQDGHLSADDKTELSKLQSGHISWNNMTIQTQNFVNGLVFNGCSD
ncbi:hypothetical protein EDB69_1242 [Vibrio crassostreae]|uniref:hypothetical protein n=1 Tax=Vibrio crassostreae TaxID=246167 RepID=UPI000F4985EE|nr:hypothetical protein [Vibrio crassostreae]ROO75476.1 hypothetical protein EDB64_0453 [Vibrio crassostreae]ROP13483.1 hypothetical protein EDB63_0477 [Vibrio crassostreae]ROQ87558.1 hypothetical protein EDB72_1106 [Vibrio crassostreae]ROR88071.1 hypothetical protein EDB66_1011 [Vibrio crassostreae]RPE95278.1 hypothetical protein EDB68_1318 [Vibrio crassostreae]